MRAKLLRTFLAQALRFFLLYCLALAVRAEMAIVVTRDSAIENLDFNQVANIFLARTKRFPGGEWATPIELINAEYRELFYRQISGKSARQLNAYWATLVFTGKGKPPQGCSTADELAARLATQPGAITYLPQSMVTDEMKVVHAFRGSSMSPN